MNSEQTLLGQIIIDNPIFHSMEITEDNFQDNEYKRIFKAIKKCFDIGVEADLITISNQDKNINAFKLANLTTNTASSANWKFYHDALLRETYKIKVKRLGLQFKDWTNSLAPEEAIKNLEEALMDITKNNSKNKIVKIKEIVPEFIKTLEERYHAKGTQLGIQTGIPELDKMMIGFRKRLLYLIGGRPSQGKSALLLNFACHAGIRLENRTGYITTESSITEIVTRLFASEGKIDSMKLITGYYTPTHFGKISHVADNIYEKNMYFYYTPGMTLDDLIQKARLMVRFYKCEILYIDYLQDIFVSGNMTNVEKTSLKSKALKHLAEELDIPIVAGAQLRRDSEERRPRLSDFADSSQLEKDADGAILIYHHHTNKKQPKETPIYESFLLVEKVRDGMTGTIPVTFKKEYVTFSPRVNYE